ncbi:hypothetical protein D8780_03180 [Notoacmeibacter ruber]|uniref:Uncharacterized protein n=2 Tax=Notoacmeibacter ruber TaxID=2670375 RepID=A0A3L7JA77_9HYPH|nr:hypothetical protein D8780_03180 [Notoacmeibacter ruber]
MGIALAEAWAGDALGGASLSPAISVASGMLVMRKGDEVVAVIEQATGKAVSLSDDILANIGARATIPDGVSFGRNTNQDYHVWRHVEDELGMSRQRVQDAVVTDLPPVADLSDGLNVRFVNIDGVRLQYNTFKLPDGTVNIGRIHEAN